MRQALRLTTKINRVPPKNFPMQFLVRFDVLTDATEPVLQSAQATKF